MTIKYAKGIKYIQQIKLKVKLSFWLVVPWYWWSWIRWSKHCQLMMVSHCGKLHVKIAGVFGLLLLAKTKNRCFKKTTPHNSSKLWRIFKNQPCMSLLGCTFHRMNSTWTGCYHYNPEWARKKNKRKHFWTNKDHTKITPTRENYEFFQNEHLKENRGLSSIFASKTMKICSLKLGNFEINPKNTSAVTWILL